MKNRKRMITALLLVISLLTVLLAGCGNPTASNSSSTSGNTPVSSSSSSGGNASSGAQKKAAAEETLSVTVYFPNEQGTKLLASARKIQTSAAKDKYTAALEALLAGPQDKGQTAIVPKKTQLRSVTLKNSTAVVNFSKELQTNFVGGSTGEEMLVGSIVDTLTEFPEVKNVHILVEGKNIETLSGHMDLSVPISRMKDVL